MATLTLTRTWVTEVGSGESVAAATTGRTQQWAVPAGEVRTYAGGRQRYIGGPGERGEFHITLRALSLTQITTLRGWKGLTVQVRDHRGQRAFGVFTEVRPNEYKDPRLYDAELTIRTVTHTEAV